VYPSIKITTPGGYILLSLKRSHVFLLEKCYPLFKYFVIVRFLHVIICQKIIQNEFLLYMYCTIKLYFDIFLLQLFFFLQVFVNYENSLGTSVYREKFDFNAEPPWDPS